MDHSKPVSGTPSPFDALDFPPKEVERLKGVIDDVLNSALGDEAEFCVLCSRKLGFSSFLHITSPVRQEGGAYYVEGGGQVCALCAVK